MSPAQYPAARRPWQRPFSPGSVSKVLPSSIIKLWAHRAQTAFASGLQTAAAMSTTTLPSFVELMASLGLENKDPADERSLRGHSRSSSYSSSVSAFSQSSGPSQPQSDYEMDASPYIVVSHPHSTPGEHEQRRHRVRYSPYTPAIVSVRSFNCGMRFS